MRIAPPAVNHRSVAASYLLLFYHDNNKLGRRLCSQSGDVRKSSDLSYSNTFLWDDTALQLGAFARFSCCMELNYSHSAFLFLSSVF